MLFRKKNHKKPKENNKYKVHPHFHRQGMRMPIR